jgi:hypothetical protein
VKPRLLYLCDFLPGADSGGALVIDRHLRRLAREGWEVTVSVPAAAIKTPPVDAPYAVRPLAARRWWWPPVSPRWPWTQRVRAALWARAAVADPQWAAPPDAVLTVLWGHAALAAARAAAAWRTPLAVIVHDLFRETKLPPARAAASERLTADVLAAADHVWTVSDEMRAALAPLACRGAITTLPPVPDDTAAPAGDWQPRFRATPVIAHAGALHAHHVGYLGAVARAAEKCGGTLLVLARADNPALARLRAAGVAFRHQSTFATSAEALAFLAREASALTVMYPFDPVDEKNPPTGFPSRVLEFSHLGLPMIFAAPPGNPLHSWARRHDWPLVLERADWTALDALVARLADAPQWAALSARMRDLAAHACNPEKIHRQFLAELPRRPASP